MKHVEVGPDGARLGYVELAGQGPAIVYVHGLGACGAPYLAASVREPGLADRHLLVPDLLGFGVSDRPASFGYTLADHAGTIARLLDALGVRGAHVVGHSMGGGVAVLLAQQRPDLVARLVLVEPSLRPSPRPLVEPYSEAEYVRTGFALRLADAGPQWAATMRLADPVAMYRSELALGAAMPVLDEVLLGLAMPRAIVEGELSGWLADDPRLRAAGVPVHVVPGTTHVMMLEDPPAFARALRAALAADAAQPVGVAATSTAASS
ncbi:alpha/beta fold hydrolase [Cellulomonas composti]|nr:alpha/beta hydrolase [Cellulomonas composti]